MGVGGLDNHQSVLLRASQLCFYYIHNAKFPLNYLNVAIVL